jgi:flagellar biosynthesis/type III secretory pathway chaperone
VASLVDELLDDLRNENAEYEKLLVTADQKRQMIINGETEELEAITAKEEQLGNNLKAMEGRRVQILKDMAVVMGHDGEQVTVTQIIDMLNNQPEERDALTTARDQLLETATQLQIANRQNEILLQQALEMVEFDLTLFKSLRQAPQTANYGQDAYTTGDILGGSSFDSSQ